MARNFTKTIAALAVSALAITPIAVGVSVLTVDAAVAKPGGNGNGNGNDNGNGRGNGNGNRNADKPRGQENAAANRGGARGAIASELGGLNAAHASQTALENASPDSMPGKLYIYQQTGGITVADIQAFNDAKNDKAALEDMTEDEKLAEYDADGDGILSDEELKLHQDAIAEAQAILDEHDDAYAALAALKDGSLTLTEAALNELNKMLGL